MGNDVVHNPSHYTEGRKHEPKDVIRDWGLNFNLGNAVKYIARAGRKDDIVQDLRKAQEYIQFEIDAIEAERYTGHDDKLDAILYGMDPIMRALVMEEACTVKPIVVEVPNGLSEEKLEQLVKNALRR